jgi:Ser/Thr protein kinase RdoA (MazF antagonist)
VYGFSRAGRSYVLRIGRVNEEYHPAAVQAALEWMRYQAEHGGYVLRPLASVGGSLIELLEAEGQTWLALAIEEARGVLSERLPLEAWDDSLFHSLGRTVGKMHQLAKEYRPASPALRRPDWEETGSCFNPPGRGDPALGIIAERREKLMAHIHNLPKDPACYGLIHADLHFGNFFVDAPARAITLFDFDDCAYGWYVMDVAMLLFDILVLYSGEERQPFATRYLKNFLAGYRAETELSSKWICELPTFLKLVEIGVYIEVYPDYDPQDTTSWVGKFMPGRKQRIEENQAYIDLDFASLSAA